MFNKIIAYSIKNKLVIGLLVLALIVWGVYSLRQLPIDAVPDITNNQVQVITICPTLAGQEVEQFVTYPIEQAVANLPDIVELRSISRFGLSIITIVFEEKVNVWFARQLVGEKLREAEELIPPGIGKPELAPVSTGLGEIYQYVIHPKPGSEDKYDAMDLRTMQDWIVARQLYGTPGVAEVNSLGGLVKQYEVALSPDRLLAMDVTISEVFRALENNNENTGGAYIDKKPYAYFIRGIGLVTSLDDVRKIIVKNAPNGIPILIGDVADVRFGSALRYGALTYNGEKEAVGGMVMMLKGANSAEVVKRVKEKMKVIQKSLPEDVIIEPFLDRTNLVNRAIRTVETNLLEGALIVIFVLVLFLGNLRAGLIVASAIPLSMLFALGMMNVFGVSANLMSLGAIDFGLIVDGAVIVVEATLHTIGRRKLPAGHSRLTQSEMDAEVERSAKRMMNSAAFGQIIILIVYIPILSLVGIEGKMFRPMAQTVSFAILGALLLSLTYIPMMSALFLPKKIRHKQAFSDRMMAFFQGLYAPLLEAAIRFRYAVIAAALALFVLAVWQFGRLGGEFIPKLEEGDYAFHCILPTGSSLSQSLETSMQAMRLIRTFPEVKMVVGKTGSAEVPTDPMPPEATDMIIILKDKDEWTTTGDYNELANRMMEKLAVIPGIVFEVNQPIQMRFNELMTGIRQDVAVKIFGENMDTLAAYAPLVAQVVQGVAGATDPQIERTTGLPQITIEYDRNRLANYGIDVEGVNHIVSTAFAGEKAGFVFENERRFDLVVRLDSAHRNSIDDVSELYVPTPSGSQIPLSQVAGVSFKQGPAQISRDNGKRRIVVGFNVRERDVQSVVEEIREKLGSQVKLPAGYYYTFGGAFENLERANARLRIAVPAAMALIFILLYFTFHSFKPALLIYTAIPMSAIGGVFALSLRGMSFSISAGVGFIALFGVAVLNGIVLIAAFNQLKEEGMDEMIERVRKGTRIRLRPVLMTAAVASLGFLPMAISTGAGAEVQKPLATVVIGGLISATFLTLVVLPLLYIIFAKSTRPIRRGTEGMAAGVIAAGLLLLSQDAEAQIRLPLSQAVETAFQNNLQIQANQLEIERANALTGSWLEVPRTGFFFENEDFSPEDKNGLWKIGLSQSLESPGFYKAQRELLQRQLRLSETSVAIAQAELHREVNAVYYQLWYVEQKQQLYRQLDSLYSNLLAAAALRVRTGDAADIERIAAETRLQEVKMQAKQLQNDLAIAQQTLMRALNTDQPYLPESKPLEKNKAIPVATFAANHPLLLRQQQQVSVAEAGVGLAQKAKLPAFSGRVFSQRLYGVSSPVSGFSFSVGVPLFGKAFKTKIEAARVENSLQQRLLQLKTLDLQTATNQALQALARAEEALLFYETTGLRQAREIIEAAEQAYRAGEISFAELSQFLTQAVGIQQHHLDALNEYNQAAIQYQYLISQ